MNDESRPKAAPESPAKATGTSVPLAADNGRQDAPFQVMPPLSPEQYGALREDIARRGVLVPVVVDQHGRILDGHHRRAIADSLGVDCPVEVREVADDDAARDVALTLNLARRHLTREQRREMVAAEVEARPDDSDRAIARRFGCSPSTVGSVRAQASNLDSDGPLTEEESTALAEHEATIERSLAETRTALAQARTKLQYGCIAAMSNAVTTAEVVAAITTWMRAAERQNPKASDVLHGCVFAPVLDWLLEPGTAEQWRPQWDHPTFLPLAADERRGILLALAGDPR